MKVEEHEATGTAYPMKIHRIRLKNFHCFEDREFSFGSRFNLIIGDNATGKTTLLDALSVGLGFLFMGFPEPADPRNLISDDVRLATFHHGDSWTVERQYPTQIECFAELDGHSGSWRRERWGKKTAHASPCEACRPQRYG